MKAWKLAAQGTLKADYKGHSFNTGKENTSFNNALNFNLISFNTCENYCCTGSPIQRSSQSPIFETEWQTPENCTVLFQIIWKIQIHIHKSSLLYPLSWRWFPLLQGEYQVSQKLPISWNLSGFDLPSHSFTFQHGCPRGNYHKTRLSPAQSSYMSNGCPHGSRGASKEQGCTLVMMTPMKLIQVEARMGFWTARLGKSACTALR